MSNIWGGGGGWSPPPPPPGSYAPDNKMSLTINDTRYTEKNLPTPMIIRMSLMLR